jgi:short-subunit dehydrogenase
MQREGDQLVGNWAVVTGASSGIGQVFARELCRRGYRVLAIGRRRERLEALAQEAAQAGGFVEPLIADLTTQQGLDGVVRRIVELGKIELLINNAGVATAGDFLAASLEREMAQINLNVEATVRLTHEAIGRMVKRGRGAVINVASVVAFQPFPHFAVYAASKSFVLCFSESLAQELRGTGVRVMALCPGATRTELGLFAHNPGLLGKLPSLTAEQVVRAGLRALDRGRVVKVVDGFNNLLVFLNRLAPRWVMRWVMGAVVKPPDQFGPRV